MLELHFLQLIAAMHHDYLIPIAPLVAQMIEDPDILGQMQDAWFNFVESGQAWALLIGMFLGYTFKGFII